MKTDTGNKIRLGIFLSIGMAAFIIGIYFIGEGQQFFTTTFRVSAVFSHVSGLQAGNNVRLSGINIGTVDEVNLVSDTSVQVIMLIDESIRRFIRKDAIATIGSEGIMGNTILVLQPGTGDMPEIEEGDVVQTVRAMDVADIMGSLKTTLDNTSNITRDLALITRTIQTGDGIVNLEQIMKSLKTAADKASEITEHLAIITERVQSGKGTIGRLVMDSTLAEDFNSAIVNLKHGSEGFLDLIARTDTLLADNLDTTAVNLRKASGELLLLLEEAKSSWLLWGF